MIEIRGLEPLEAHQSAQRLQGESRGVESGLPVGLDRVFGWTTWPDEPGAGRSFLVSRGREPLLLFRIEPDPFNSSQLHANHARVHWLRASTDAFDRDAIQGTARTLRKILLGLEWELVAIRVLDHDRVALEILETAGFRMILANGWFYRGASLKPPSIPIPPRTRFELRSLRGAPMSPGDTSQYLAVAREGFFHDRISAEALIPRDLVMKRFCAIVENGLKGRIADYLMTARTGSRIDAFAFFGVSLPKPGLSSLPVAGRWLSGFSRGGVTSRGRCALCLAESIRCLPEGKAYWVYACALDNFRSVETSRRLGFRLGMVAHDLHWRKETVCSEVASLSHPLQG